MKQHVVIVLGVAVTAAAICVLVLVILDISGHAVLDLTKDCLVPVTFNTNSRMASCRRS